MGMIEAETYTLVQLALAEIYFNTGDYKNAAALYDEAFLLLSDKYREYYRKNRDLAYEFMENPPASMEVSEIIAEEILNYKHLIFYILLDTNFFENITADRNIEPEELLNKLIERGYIHEKDTALGDTCMRKDISFLFLNILVYLTNNTGLLDKYRKSYLELNKPSPVPDVKTKDYFFDAVLVLVEREIMSLPDGINFFPEESMSGLELSEIVNQLKRMY
jgi:tetratricopeptide (TPR) repeat protein